MGQYWKVANLDKREYVDPHKLGTGLKLWEQLANHPGTGAALVILCAAMPEPRGGGGLTPNEIVGRWAGDRIALVGDYAERGDLPTEHDADLIYALCSDDGGKGQAEHWKSIADDYPSSPTDYRERARRLRAAAPYTDISEQVCAVIEAELGGTFSGDGWRSWTYND